MNKQRPLIEQSYPAGSYYYSRFATENDKQRLISDSVEIDSLHFKTSAHVYLYLDMQNPFKYYVQTSNTIYAYYKNQLVGKISALPQTKLSKHQFVFGQVEYKDEECNYFSCDDHQTDAEPDFNDARPPANLSGYPYDMKFYYQQELINLLKDVKATFVDCYKRPLNYAQFIKNRYYPSAIAKSTKTFKDLANFHTHYPIVVNLNADPDDPPLATLDLEPHFTKEELALANSFEAYYVEETPHGGRHYLVKPKTTDAFKYRISEHLEVQVKTMITFYGIHGRFLNSEVAASDFSSYKEVGHGNIAKPVKLDEDKYLAESKAFYQIVKRSINLDNLLFKYNQESDLSKADWLAVSHIYRNTNIALKLSQLDHQKAPYLLAYAARQILPYRPKYDELRDGVSFLVYTAASVLSHFGFVYE